MSINITVSLYCHFLERADAIGLFFVSSSDLRKAYKSGLIKVIISELTHFDKSYSKLLLQSDEQISSGMEL